MLINTQGTQQVLLQVFSACITLA